MIKSSSSSSHAHLHLVSCSPLNPPRASTSHKTVRMRSAPLLFALFSAARSPPALSFLIEVCSRRSLKASKYVSHERLRTTTIGIDTQRKPAMVVANLVGVLVLKGPEVSLPRSSRRFSRLQASEEGLSREESIAVPSEVSSTPSPEALNAALVEAAGGVTAPGSEGNGVGGTAVGLAKGIAFEKPKPKDVAAEEDDEEGSEAKKLRVILYTVLSLVPFLLLLPFLGSRDFVPLDPNQM